MKSFNTWKAYWERRTRGTIALVHYYGGLMDKVWMVWGSDEPGVDNPGTVCSMI